MFPGHMLPSELLTLLCRPCYEVVCQASPPPVLQCAAADPSPTYKIEAFMQQSHH